MRFDPIFDNPWDTIKIVYTYLMVISCAEWKMEKESTQKLAQARKGCIKTTMGPWIARRIGADGVERTSLRRPSPAEREKNRQRERHRRSVKARIYSCLRAYGNYRLPKHPDHNDILMALCQEAGWHVEEDGTIYRKENTPGTSKTASGFDFEVGLFGQGDEEKCQYGVDVGFGAADHQDELSLTLSLQF